MSSEPAIDVHEMPGRPILEARKAPPCAVVIFGALGDLTKRKLVPALYNLLADGALPDGVGIIGVGRRAISNDEYRENLRASTVQYSRRKSVDDALWQDFAGRVELAHGDFEQDGVYQQLAQMLGRLDQERGTAGNRLFYLAIPPDSFPIVLDKLHSHGLVGDGGKVIIEKPFGTDLGSARALNDLVAKYLTEKQTYRIDHYLGKESVQNILVFRFGNSIFEPLWNRKYIDHVQITASEAIGVEGRGKFYEQTGVMRDVVQNHLLQVLALCTMEPPSSFSADDIRDEKAQLLRSIRPISDYEVASHVVRGQYRGYRREAGVAPDSRTPTYAAMKIMIDNWRWQGVPIYLRAGKKLAQQRTDISIHFQSIPFCLFKQEDACQLVEPNVLTIRIQPNEGMTLRYVAKVPGEQLSVANVQMSMTYAEAVGKPLAEAYERLLLDCMSGDQTLFARRDEVDNAWKFVTPILDAWDADTRSELAFYDDGHNGPAEADHLLFQDNRRWRDLQGSPLTQTGVARPKG
ncbi:MAG: glucose-6-phosphate dehydrogenase [Myxococcota bacterium]